MVSLPRAHFARRERGRSVLARGAGRGSLAKKRRSRCLPRASAARFSVGRQKFNLRMVKPQTADFLSSLRIRSGSRTCLNAYAASAQSSARASARCTFGLARGGRREHCARLLSPCKRARAPGFSYSARITIDRVGVEKQIGVCSVHENMVIARLFVAAVASALARCSPRPATPARARRPRRSLTRLNRGARKWLGRRRRRARASRSGPSPLGSIPGHSARPR